jgi:hypothetical protein
MNKIRTALILLLLPLITFTQQLSGDIEIYLKTIVDEMPGSSGNYYDAPTSEEIETWENGMQAFLAGSLSNARQILDVINYEIIEYSDVDFDPDISHYIFHEKTPQANYWGIYIFSVNPLRPDLVLQAPHPKYDTNTGYQGIFCFKRSRALALFISGTHRCNHSAYSPCSGSTSVCGSNEPYRISDNAHNVNSIYQKSTELVYLYNENSKFVQLHGFGKQASDPYVIMSNGTRITPEVDYLQLIRDQLQFVDPVLTFKIANIDLDWDRLIAFSNTQGRLINGSTDPCYENASNSEGLFIHIEQEKTRLRQDSVGWNKMLFALGNVFPEDTSTNISQIIAQKSKIAVYPNPTAGKVNISTSDPANIFIYDMNGVLIRKFEMQTSGQMHAIELNGYKSGIYFITIRTQQEIYHEKVVLLD